MNELVSPRNCIGFLLCDLKVYKNTLLLNSTGSAKFKHLPDEVRTDSIH